MLASSPSRKRRYTTRNEAEEERPAAGSLALKGKNNVRRWRRIGIVACKSCRSVVIASGFQTESELASSVNVPLR